jgi:hypothetical protein
VTVLAGQLALDVPDTTADPLEALLDTLDFDDHEARLDALDHARSRVDPLDAFDFQPPAPAPTCTCTPHGLHATDEEGTVTCWACGREASL